MDLQLVDHAIVREDHQVRVRRRNEQILDKVTVLRGSAKAALAAASLSRVCRYRSTFDVTAVRDRDRHVFIGDQIFDRKLNAFVNDLRSTLVTKIFLNALVFLCDDATPTTL